MFKLPILDILDRIKNPNKPTESLLDLVIRKMYSEETSVAEIAASLCISEFTVYERIPKDQKKTRVLKAKIARAKPEIIRMHKLGQCPKELAFDFDISVHPEDWEYDEPSVLLLEKDKYLIKNFKIRINIIDKEEVSGTFGFDKEIKKEIKEKIPFLEDEYEKDNKKIFLILFFIILIFFILILIYTFYYIRKRKN